MYVGSKLKKYGDRFMSCLRAIVETMRKDTMRESDERTVLLVFLWSRPVIPSARTRTDPGNTILIQVF